MLNLACLIDDDLVTLAAEDINTTAGTVATRKPAKIKSDIVNWESYAAILRGVMPDFYNNLQVSNTKECLDTLVNHVSKLMYTTAKHCQYQRLEDQPCQPLVGTEEEIQATNDANVMLQSYLKGEISCDDWMCCRNEVNRLLMHDYCDEELQNWKAVIVNNDASKLWKKINWKGEVQNSADGENSPSPDALTDHFQSKSRIDVEDEDIFILNSDNYVHELDKPITVDKIEDECKHLKPSKSTYDGWSPLMITSISGFLFSILSIIFSFILLNRAFPTAWVTSLINAIFKNKGSRHLAVYFCPISLVHMLSKLLDVILLSRFKKWFKPADEQSAYQSGRSCADNIFLTRCLISLAKKCKKKLFLVAVDFEGAFDRVNRSNLFRKSVKFGAGNSYVACLMAIYSKTEYIIFGNNEVYATYRTEAGIKQGSPLSPYLFLFYINDKFDFFLGVFGSYCIYETVYILMHADEAVLIASSSSLAILKLKHLLAYCNTNNIKLEASKSQFIVINGENSDY